MALTILYVIQYCLFDGVYTHSIRKSLWLSWILVLVVINFVSSSQLASGASALISTCIISCAIIVHKTQRDS